MIPTRRPVLIAFVALAMWIPAAGFLSFADSAVGVWSPADALNSQGCKSSAPNPQSLTSCIGHANHIAVPLDRTDCRRGSVAETDYPCGNVLVAGGYTDIPGGGSASSPSLYAQLYNPAAAETGVWRPTGSMNQGRGTASGTLAAVLLDGPDCRAEGRPPEYCGRVLVVGGNNAIGGNNSTGVATSEIYDPMAPAPATGTIGRWQDLAQMPGLFRSPVATLLDGPGCADKCGLVLATGVDTGAAALYDPASNEWEVTGGFIIPRSTPTPPAVLLAGPGCADKCGMVLVAGGQSQTFQMLEESELYDPATGTWQPTGFMQSARKFHAATLLTGPRCFQPSRPAWCGNVLVAGGDNNTDEIATAEVYRTDPGDWVDADPMSMPRAAHTLTPLPDGRVLAVGGRCFAGNCSSPDEVQLSAEVYDPDANSWTTAITFPQDGFQENVKGSFRRAHSATLLPSGPAFGCGINCGKVLVTGGLGAPNDGSGPEPAVDIVTAELFAPSPALVDIVPPVCGGAEVVINGTGLASATSVSFGADAAASFHADPAFPDSRMFAVSPNRASGTESVIVTTPVGTTQPRSFSYPSPPVIASLTPDRGPVAGGTPVTITGTDLRDVRAVKFGSEKAASFQVLSDTQISAISPSHLRAETVDLNVTVGGCTSQRPFTYFTLPLSSGDPANPAGGAAVAAQSSTGVDGGGPASLPGSQQSIGGTAPPATPSGPPPSASAPAVLTASPPQIPGSPQSSVPTLVSGAPMVSSGEAATPGAGLAAAPMAHPQEPAVRHAMVGMNLRPLSPAFLACWATLGGIMLFGCCAAAARRREPLPGVQAAF